jgi:hypothetical protein
VLGFTPTFGQSGVATSIVSKNYFKPRINAPISDNKKLNSLNFYKGHHANPTMPIMFMDPKIMFILKQIH